LLNLLEEYEVFIVMQNRQQLNSQNPELARNSQANS